MNLQGKHFIGGALSSSGTATFSAINPANGERLEPPFHESTEAEVQRAVEAAAESYPEYKSQAPERRAELLERIAEEILALGDELISRARTETALPEARLTGERARTIGQLKMFAALIRQGSWVEACIDRGIPDRKPAPKPDLRKMLVPIGPVAVFAASNFPLAFSVAGGDTASALAAGNPVVVKAHPAHPGTSELMAKAVRSAIEATLMPDGVFSMLHATDHSVSLSLVKHPLIRAVGFTGSLKAGRSLFNTAAARPDPIPVYAEMGSTNPVFVLPGALRNNGDTIAEGLVQSVTLGVGQFCTNPGLVFGLKDASLAALTAKTGQIVAGLSPGTMLYQGLCGRFKEGVERVSRIAGVRVAGRSASSAAEGQALPVVFEADARTFEANEALQEELFGPSTLVVSCASKQEMERLASGLPGQLTASIHGTPEDLAEYVTLVSILREKAGRLIFNGFPTGVEVIPSMHHGGPYPATTAAYFTSVGTAAIKRFVRPVCFQNFPDAALPEELRNQNTCSLWRLVDGQMTRDNL